MEEDEFRLEREAMVREQIERRGIRDKRVLEALRNVPRHLFVPPEERRYAYHDGPLPIGEGQTISQPYIVAVMTELLELQGDENVLEIGTGSGYQAAVLGRLARTVHTVERYARLAQRAEEILRSQGINNVFVHVGDGSLGWPAHAPYHAIVVTAAAPVVPPALLDQLLPGGRLVIPVGGPEGQMLERWVRKADHLEREVLFAVAFVPLRGAAGWSEGEWSRRGDF
ncbi:MAG TPA: protein-L-isoaspartate O-methyltransferase [Anaerolinea thermolimosa]|uniref:Protein-L-isoaspartate O-methyltransferase n=1 Tax=Anaerolinea thermolimosa TaxID=229919 RepID=A0A3D1JGB0_9CHLR|nr:protein-L-isoaspartate O-methyltransferase [Anaerolinea thermolimosa]